MAFHVPCVGRVKPEQHPTLGSTDADGNNGAFGIGSPEPGWMLYLICSDGMGWEHVSVRAHRESGSRVPTWKEMAYVKRMCWDAEDVVMQLHPKESEYVNNHPHVLH